MGSAVKRTMLRWPGRRRPVFIAGVGVAGIVSALTLLIVLTGAERLEPDEIVRDYGTYVSPGRRFQLVVRETANRTICVELESPVWWQRIVARFLDRSGRSRRLPDLEFEVERDWFLCFDDYDRIWIFVGQWDRGWGPLRRLPSGGTRPYTQTVTMSGFYFRWGRPVAAKRVVSSTGDWRGVPPRFFEQIPGRENSSIAVWGMNPPIPAVPPKLTPAERAAAAAFW